MIPFEIVSVNRLRAGDHLLLDSGISIRVQRIEFGHNKDQMAVHLAGRPPLLVNGYFQPFMRRIVEKQPTYDWEKDLENISQDPIWNTEVTRLRDYIAKLERNASR